MSATQLNATSARVSWVPPLGVPPTLYNINVYYTPVEINGQMQHTSVPGTSNSLVLTQLNEGPYIIVVIVGDETASAIIIIIIIGMYIEYYFCSYKYTKCMQVHEYFLMGRE